MKTKRQPMRFCYSCLYQLILRICVNKCDRLIGSELAMLDVTQCAVFVFDSALTQAISG